MTEQNVLPSTASGLRGGVASDDVALLPCCGRHFCPLGTPERRVARGDHHVRTTLVTMRTEHRTSKAALNDM